MARRREPRLKVEEDGRLVKADTYGNTSTKEKDNEDDGVGEILIQNPNSGMTTDNDVRFRFWIIGLYAAIPTIGIFGAMPVMLPRHGYGHFDLDLGEILHYLVAVWLAVQFGYNVIMLYAADCGRLTRHMKPSLEMTGQFEVNLGDRNKLPPHIKDVKVYYAPRWCYKCKLWQPPRCRHCDICKYCVLRQDHHSVLSNRCIGLRNHGYWAMYLLYCIFGGAYSVYLSVHCLYMSWDTRLIHKESDRHKWWLGHHNSQLGSFLFIWNDVGHCTFFFMIASAFVGFYAGLMGVYFFGETLKGLTRSEVEFEKQEFIELDGGNVAPINAGFYAQKGPWANVIAVLGENWFQRAVMPVPGEPDPKEGLCPPLAPEALRQVIKRVDNLKKDRARTEGGML